MIINISKAILHIFDLNSGINVFSEEELNVDNSRVVKFLSQHIEKSYNEAHLKSGEFLENSKFREQVKAYFDEKLEFISFSRYIAELMDTFIGKSGQLNATDIIVCDFTVDNKRFVGILECINRVEFTHQIIKDDGKVKSDIIHHHAILPGPGQKLSGCVFIDYNSLDIKFSDKKRDIDGEKILALPDMLLECSTVLSPRESIKKVNSIARKVAENHGEDPMIIASRAKGMVLESWETEEELDMIDIGKKVFKLSPVMQEEFTEKIEKAGIPRLVKLDEASVKATMSHKLKTDTGIEITVPVDYFKNKDYFDIVNNSDGTLTINLKNIGKIMDR